MLKHTHTSKLGFSIVVVALMLVIFGSFVIMTVLPPAASTFDKVVLTQKKLNVIRTAINTYYALNKSYPCPASFILPVSNGAFGLETNSDITTNCRSAAICVGVGVVCPILPLVNKTWVGAIPVRTMGLADDYEFDGWGNRFTYVVNNNSVFTVNTYNGRPRYLNYYALSHGPNGNGAYNHAGNITKICTLLSGASTTLSEYENCNFTADDTFIFRPWNAGTDYYDDIGMN